MISTELPLQTISKAQKLLATEQLWEDLCQNNQMSLPTWHKDVLNQREQAVNTGKSHFTDWQTAKNEMRAMVK